ncbi:unnamed protein product [Aphanomyces euteiches]
MVAGPESAKMVRPTDMDGGDAFDVYSSVEEKVLALLDDSAMEDEPWLEDDMKYLDKPGLDKVFICHECGIVFSKPSHLAQHELSHKSKGFYCPHEGCEKLYTRKDHLTRHIKVEHDDTTPTFTCSLCQATFRYKHGLRRHDMEKHQVSADKPYQCSVCHQHFKKKTQLQQHSFCHTGVLPFPCPDCDQAFMKKFQLDKHRLRSHVVATVVTVDFNSDKPIPVDDFVPTRIECPECHEFFLTKKSLRGHVRGVHMAQSFECSDCSNSYSSQANLNKHRRIAHEEGSAKYKCDLCPQAFHYKHVLRKHMEKTHDRPQPARKRKRTQLDEEEIRKRLIGNNI